ARGCGVSKESNQLFFRASATEGTSSLTRALRTFLRFVDTQRSAIHLKAVQRLDCVLCLALRHVDESEAARLAGFTVIDELDRIHFAVTFEEYFYVLLSGVEGQIAHVDRRHPEVSLEKADSGEPHESVACTA